jgi:hypothetical protein
VQAASAVRGLAAAKGVTPGQIAPTRLLHKGPDIVPIPRYTPNQHAMVDRS